MSENIDWINEPLETPRPEPRSLTINNQDVGDIFGREIARLFGEDHAGTITDGASALQIVAVSSAVNFISDQISALPVHIYKDTDQGPEYVSDELSRKLKGTINPEFQTFEQLLKTMVSSYLLNGRAYAYLEKDKLDRITAIYSIPYENITVQRIRGKKVYTETFVGGRIKHHKPENIIDFVMLLDGDGINSYNPVKTHSKTLTAILNVEKYTRTTFGKNGIPPLQLISNVDYQTPANQKRAGDAIEKATKAVYSQNSQVLVPPAGHKLEKIGLDPATLQLLESKKWNLAEIARIFNLPPQFLQDLSYGTYSNTEQQSHNLVKFLLQPMVSNLERELNSKIFGNDSDQYIKFNFGALQRGDFTSQINGLSRAVLAGIMTPNEARELLEYGKKENGDNLFMQGANQPLEALLGLNRTEQDGSGDPASNGAK